MRTETPSPRWIKRWLTAHVAAGGWGGPATVRDCLESHVVTLYRLGATPVAAGHASARDYRLLSRITTLEETTR